MTHPHPNRRFVPQAVLTKSGKINTAGASVNTAVRLVNTAGSKPTVNHPRSISNAYKKGYSQVTRPFNKYSEYKNNIFNKKVNTVRVKDTTARDRAVVSENKGKGVNVVKASACWGNPQQKEYKEKGVIDSGCSRHMTGNKCYLTEYKDYDGGFVSFGDGKGRISRKGKIKTGTLDFDNNGVTERRNRTLIEAARTMLVDSKLPTTFWAEAVNTACYVLNRVLVIKPHNKTPYELIRGRTPLIDFMKPFGCPVTILNTRDHLGKFDGKADEGFFCWLEKEKEPGQEYILITWLFDIDLLTNSMNYEPVTIGNQTNKNAVHRAQMMQLLMMLVKRLMKNQQMRVKEMVPEKEGGALNKEDDQNVQDFRAALDNLLDQQKKGYTNSTNRDSTVSLSVIAAGKSFTNANDLPIDPLMPGLDYTSIFSGAYDDDDVGAEAELNNLETSMNVYRNKKDERGIVVRNKARLVAQGYTQEEGIDYDEVFAPDARIEAMRLFLAYASFMGFIMYQMDVKSAFVYGTIEEEVYVCQPPSFEDPQFPDKVYKVENALYGLHQAPRAWYETLFIKKDKGDILLVQVYVDDIIFGSTKKSLCVEFK
ncbi:putative ribonuclease H-like domain-containing protein [Tanacetum coccineum]